MRSNSKAIVLEKFRFLQPFSSDTCGTEKSKRKEKRKKETGCVERGRQNGRALCWVFASLVTEAPLRPRYPGPNMREFVVEVIPLRPFKV